MKNLLALSALGFAIGAASSAGLVASRAHQAVAGQSAPKPASGFVLEHEPDVIRHDAGPHNGGGQSTAYNYFDKAPGFKLAFRKRVLHPGSSIGYHLQKEDEVYYVLSGTGEMTINGEKFLVKPGDGILTRPGSSHGIKPTGNEDLVLIINYEK